MELSAQIFRDAWWGSEGEFDCGITLCTSLGRSYGRKTISVHPDAAFTRPAGPDLVYTFFFFENRSVVIEIESSELD